MTDYYISNAGGGTGLSQGSPFKFSDLWSVAAAGSTCYVLDGTYTGANSMIDNSSAAHGTSGAPITIKAINDGAVFINGEDARKPVKLHQDYYILEGINAGNSNAEVYDITGSHNIIRRCVGWDAEENNNVAVFSIYDGDQFDSLGDIGAYNLVEDCAGFGTGRKILTSSAGASHSTFRRCFGRVEGSNSTAGPRCALDIGYDALYDTAENCISTIDRDRAFSTPFEDIGNLQNMGRTITGQCARHTAYYGCIGYLLSTQSAYDSVNGLAVPLADNAWFDYVDSLIYIAPGTHTGQAAYNIQDYNGTGASGCGSSNPSPGQRRIVRGANIGGVASNDSLSADVSYTNFFQVGTVAALYGSESLYSNNGTKPTIRYRYEDRALTSTELWPWPMNQRIIDAMVLAGRTPIDVDATIQAIFGTFTATGLFVSKSGNDSNTGRSGSPKLTIASAIASHVSGETITIGPGVYEESLRDVIIGGTSGAPTIIKASAPNSVTLRPTGGTDVIRINADYVTIDGIDADAVNCSGAPFDTTNSGNGVSHVIMKNGRARNGSGAIVDGTANQFFNMRVYGNAAGLKVQGGSGNLASNNAVYGNAGTYGIWISAGSGNRVENNAVFGNSNDAITDAGTGSVIDHNLQTDPKWVDPANGDFRLQVTSPAIDAGVNLSQYYATDCVGNARA